MITIRKQDDKYGVYHGENQLGVVALYRNINHNTNCYVKLDIKDIDNNLSAELFGNLTEIAGCPLQAMVDSDNAALVEFFLAGGFVCRRKCYEVEACADDYIGGFSDMQLCRCSIGTPDYDHCCHLMYCYYTDIHKAINPLTAGYESFCAALPGAVIYAKCEGKIASLAFVECNEIAYVCGTDKEQFSRFSRALASSMLAEYKNIFFECDDCDWAAMMLKSLFINQYDASFDTYIKELPHNG